VESPEYIDATAEETCPAASGPISEPDKGLQRAAGEPTEAPSVASLEVMDQLKALAQNVTQANQASSDQSNASHVQSNKSEGAGASDPGGSQAPEPSIKVFPRPTGCENNQVINDRSKFRNQVLTLAGLVVAVLIGAGGTFAWQTQLKSNDAVTTAAPALVAPAPVVAPYVGRQLEELAEDISSLHHRMEELAAKQQQLVAAQQQLEQVAVKQQQLAAKQEQVGQSIAKLQALEQARQRAPAPVQSRAAAVPPRPSVPPPAVEATIPPLSPSTASHPIPPLPVPMTR
jgi:DNA repair exonuclease SbcCD ATPase subunit